ncbi:Protein kinase C iota type [Heterocephalus glaber]|uniref:Protein kinase C iota type n=1 Tax=Heterocephalus glaber TaxID=10181 RepID=G5AT94_HETGA|nr:Protein kinase C iota type [Heterocephalus glaber]
MTVTDTPGMVSLGVTTSDLPKSRTYKKGRLQFQCGLLESRSRNIYHDDQRVPFHLDESSDNPYENSVEHVLQVILERDIVIPHFLSVQAASVLEGFLNKDPKERLGCHPHRGFADIQEHPFFQNVDWDMMEQKQVVPPFKPNISEPFGLGNFDPEFTDEPVWLTPDDNDVVRDPDGYEFAGFKYINCLMMYEEEGV